VIASPLALLVFTAGAVGVLHTVVPDHWAPIAVIARQRRWSRRETARAAAGAGLGHTLSTLLIGVVAWAAGSVAAARYGRDINIAAGFALVAFGLWSAFAGLREIHSHEHAAHSHEHELRSHASSRTALLLILGSSPSVEVLPAFLAAAPLGAGALALMAGVFGVTTIATYVITCTLSAAGLQHMRLPKLERYGEVISGAVVCIIGVVFLIWFR
jgi:putative Mn2+ efflux pump MntP